MQEPKLEYDVVYIGEGGGDITHYDNMRDVVRNHCDTDTDIVAVAKAKLGDRVDIGEGAHNFTVFVVNPSK